MKFKKNILYLIIVLFAFVSCKKSGGPVSPPETTDQNPPVDVYAAGYSYNYATFWKNGVATKLVTDTSVHSQANAITVAGNDVYIAGTVFGVATYWKNGITTKLSNGPMVSFGEAIAVSGNDVYVAGAMGTKASVSVAEYWKNGVPIRLVTDTTNFSWVYGIAISGSDVYMAGYTFDAATGFTVATYWKNGVATNLTDQSGSGANAIAINGSDIYVAGGIGNTAVYWKNGVAHNVGDAGTTAVAIVTGNNGPYVAVVQGPAESSYWHNSLVTNLPFFSLAQSITLNGTDVYIGGGITGDNGNYLATYWKNGVPVELSHDGFVQAIITVPK